MIKYPGQIWMAIHPWSEKIRYHFKDGRPASTPSMFKGERPCRVSVEFKRHPAIILSPGDEGCKGYLVCYLSSRSSDHDPIPRRRLGGVNLRASVDSEDTAAKESFLFCTAPCYCPDEFFSSEPFPDRIESPMFDLLRGYLMRACQLMDNQRWEVLALADLVPADSTAEHERLRQAIRDLLAVVCNARSDLNVSTSPSLPLLGATIPDQEFDSVLSR